MVEEFDFFEEESKETPKIPEKIEPQKIPEEIPSKKVPQIEKVEPEKTPRLRRKKSKFDDIHELTEENILKIFRIKKKVKLYELNLVFLSLNPEKYSLLELEKMLKDLYKRKEIRRDRNGWYSLKEVKQNGD